MQPPTNDHLPIPTGRFRRIPDICTSATHRLDPTPALLRAKAPGSCRCERSDDPATFF
jgi:hypothetical protein